MKKIKLTLLFLFILTITAAILLTGCTKKDKEPEIYDISVVNNSLVTIEPSASSATAGTTITVKVTLNTKDTYLKGVYYNDIACSETEDGYSFTMPDKRVIITAETGTYTEVLQNGFATFSDKNYKMIAMNARYDSSNASEWALTVDMDSNYMAVLKSEIISSDQSVIPSDAITVKPYSKQDLGIGGANDFEIVQAKIIVDTSKIKSGSTFLLMNFVNDNTSDKASLAVNISVCEYGQFPVAVMSETIVIEVSQAETASRQYTVRITDADHIDGSKLKPYQDFTLNSVDGKITLNVEYAKGHSYWIRISEGTEDDYQTDLIIAATEQGGAVYTGDSNFGGEGRLTFTQPNSEITLKVTENNA